MSQLRPGAGGFTNGRNQLSLKENLMLLRGAVDTNYFASKVRPMLYQMCRQDPEKVHEFVLSILHLHGREIKFLSSFLPKPDNLKVTINGVKIMPFGTAAGMDKNGDALLAFDNVFGFQEAGTVVLNPRQGNLRPRVAVDAANYDLYNAQGFPSYGLEYFMKNISNYRAEGGNGIIYVSVCGLPLSTENAVQAAAEEMRVLITTLRPYVDGFVWNPFSPNTDALRKLRTNEVFYRTGEQMANLAGDKLRLVKIGPYEPEDKESMLGLVEGFIFGGGHGVVTTNTKMFPKDKLPHGIQESWGYPSAGRSGNFLRDYRMRSVADMRSAFPDAVVVGVGGIYGWFDAFKTFEAGADMVEGYTPYTYLGTGLVREMMEGVSKKLQKIGFGDLEAFRDQVKRVARDIIVVGVKNSTED